jgi:hypothetical protein
MSKNDLGINTTLKSVKSMLEPDGRLLFAQRSTLRDRLLEWSLPALWLAVAAVVAFTFFWI